MSDGKWAHNAQETCCSLPEGHFRRLCVWMPMQKLDGRVELVGYSDSDWAVTLGA